MVRLSYNPALWQGIRVLRGMVMEKITRRFCGGCPNQTTVTSIICQYPYCNQFEVKLENEKMESAGDSIRCPECLRENIHAMTFEMPYGVKVYALLESDHIFIDNGKPDQKFMKSYTNLKSFAADYPAMAKDIEKEVQEARA